MKYEKVRGDSIAELMMQLRSKYGQSVYILQTKEIKQGGIFGSDILAKKKYEIEYMVSEGDGPYTKLSRRPILSKPATSTAVLPSIADKNPLQSQANLPKPKEQPVTTPQPQKQRQLDTNLDDLDSLIDSLKALRSKAVEPNPSSQPKRPSTDHQPLARQPQPKSAVDPASVTAEEISALFEAEDKAEPSMPVRLTEPVLIAKPTDRSIQIIEAEPTRRIDDEKSPLWRIRQRLIETNASAEFIEKFLNRIERSLSDDDRFQPNRVKSRSIEKLKDIIRIMPTVGREFGGRKILFFVGPNGSGKTTSIEKLACRYLYSERLSISLYSLDLHRRAATEQLRSYADTLGVPFFSPRFESDLREYLDRDGSDVILIDTSGMGLRHNDRRTELVRFIEVTPGHEVEVHLVLPVSLSSSLTERYMEFFDETGFEKIILTRLDETDFLANFVEAADKWNRPFSFLSDSPEVAHPMMDVSTEDVARLVLGL